MTDAVKKLFAEYEKAFNALEVEKQVSFFAEHFISAGPRGSIAQGRDEFAKMASKAAEFYRSVGQTSAKILSMEETEITREYSMVKVHWGATFAKTGNKLIEFDVTDFIQKTGLEPKIIMFIAHQDEERAMKELGLLG
ncbi:MAG: hypothetical protein FIB08_11975 [Candidatus Methanoperedens sp.]|nr:hypothetical protein [Candidatus Methanoperedens sp.]